MLIQLPNDDKELIAKGDKTKEEVVVEKDALGQIVISVEDIIRLGYDRYNSNIKVLPLVQTKICLS